MEKEEIIEYYEDIFSTKPSSYLPLIGYEDIIEDVIYWVKSGNMIFVEGDDGYGKTSVLMNVIDEFKGDGRVVYLDCQKLKRSVNIEKLLVEKYGVLGRMFKLLPQEMIVLLDNIQFLSRKNAERVKFFFDNNNIRSVVFTAQNLKGVDIHESVIHRIGTRRVLLPKQNKDTGTQILMTRIEDNELMDDKTINELFALSDYNPKLFLQNCIIVFEYAETEGKEVIKKSNLKNILK